MPAQVLPAILASSRAVSNLTCVRTLLASVSERTLAIRLRPIPLLEHKTSWTVLSQWLSTVNTPFCVCLYVCVTCPIFDSALKSWERCPKSAADTVRVVSLTVVFAAHVYYSPTATGTAISERESRVEALTRRRAIVLSADLLQPATLRCVACSRFLIKLAVGSQSMDGRQQRQISSFQNSSVLAGSHIVFGISWSFVFPS